jgi:hypothetical protein
MKAFLKKLTRFELFLVTLPILTGLSKILFEVWIFRILPEPQFIYYTNWFIVGGIMFALVVYSTLLFNLFKEKFSSVKKAYTWTFLASLIHITYFALFIPSFNFSIFFQNIFLITTLGIIILADIICLIGFKLLNSSGAKDLN